jgi:HEPN domain-containing protein
MSPEEHALDAGEYMAQARELAARIENSDPQHAMANSALCYLAWQAATLAIKAVCSHYQAPIDGSEDLGALIDALDPSIVRVPEQVKRARLLSEYAAGAGATGQAEAATSDECPEAALMAQNVVGWAEVLLRAGKPARPPAGVP